MDLTPEQQAALEEVNSKNELIFIPSRKSPERTPEQTDKLFVLIELTYKGLIQWSVDFEKKRYVFFQNAKAKATRG